MKILVVEDEYYARQRLVKIIRECDMDVELAAAVENGQDAADFLEQNTDVDVVITDIIMPRLNGLELAEYIHRNIPYVQVIIVSGYEEFDYARKAIEYEVKQYFIKPVKKEQVLDALSQLLEKQKNFRREVETEIQEMLKKLPKGYTSSKQVLTNPELMQLYMPDIANIPESSIKQAFVIQLERFMTLADAEVIERIFSHRADGRRIGGFYCQINDEYVVVASKDGNSGMEDNRLMAGEILNYLRAQLKSDISIGLSRPFYLKNKGYDAYKECLYAMNIRLMKGWNKVYEYQLPRGGTDYFQIKDENALAGALQVSDSERAAALVRCVLSRQDMLNSGDVNAYYDMILNILRTVNRYYRSLYKEDETVGYQVEIMFSRRYDLYSFKHPEELEEYLLDIIREICDREQKSQRNSGNAIIKDILHYVEHNYQYDLSLQELAEKKYFMNSSYLSRLFKGAVGKTFSRYVIELRIQKAGKLLEDKSMKINSIAAQVGYNNTSHFIQSFKKICGCTPEEYRSQKEEGKAGNGQPVSGRERQ